MIFLFERRNRYRRESEGIPYGRRKYDLPCVGSLIWKRGGDTIRKREEEVEDPNTL
jgi:hypothetical protein